MSEIKPPQIPEAPKQPSMKPDTTHQEDITKAAQRNINLIWETTQSHIALLVVGVGFLVNAIVILVVIIVRPDITVTQLALISICLQFINLTVGIVIGFYFSRTNHTAIGGIGPKPQEGQYTGR